PSPPSPVRKRRTESPIAIRSPWQSAHSVTATWLTKVPLLLSRSRTLYDPSAYRTALCRRESERSAMAISLLELRPIETSDPVSPQTAPRAGPSITTSLGMKALLRIIGQLATGQAPPSAL